MVGEEVKGEQETFGLGEGLGLEPLVRVRVSAWISLGVRQAGVRACSWQG